METKNVKLIKFLFWAGLFLLPDLCFTQSRIRVIGSLPCGETRALYNIQIGAFRVAANAERAFKILESAGFAAGFESWGGFTRVFVPRVPASEIPGYLRRLEQAGFTEAIIRENAGGPVPDGRGHSPAFANGPPGPIQNNSARGGAVQDSAVENTSVQDGAAQDRSASPPSDTAKAETPDLHTLEPAPIDLSRRTELLCRSWRSLKLDGKDIQGTGPDHIITFFADGGFFISYMDKRRSAEEGQWKWKDDTSSDFLYSWNNWKTFAVDRILELSEDRLRDQWGLENLEKPQIWESLPGIGLHD
ncbi:MAG: SPOR domain-containing protein [Spirochaetaceae bacterium]|nr:SPOR domain-containing protein [Spirochaetaceae bacterium]